MTHGSLEKTAVTLSASRPQNVRRVSLPDRVPFATRMRVILILSLLSWMMVLAIAWAIRPW
jgi:hypothetical protein